MTTLGLLTQADSETCAAEGHAQRQNTASDPPPSSTAFPPTSKGAKRVTSMTSRNGTSPQFHFGPLTTGSPAMREVFSILGRLTRSPSTLPIALIGETGTGKDVMARTFHAQSSRASNPFVVFDCGAIATNLVESELFGHERGAFTGAHQAHAGAFERANGGTLFIDEIGELPLELQPKLLRVLENRSVRRVGGSNDRPVDLRIIAATHRDLRALVSEGRFREDLYFRLAAAVVQVPPLRDRLEDLRQLVPQLLAKLGHPDLAVSDEVYEAFRTRDWPGNVRELKNTLACAVTFVDSGTLLETRHLSFLPSAHQEPSLESVSLGGQTLEEIERAAIKQTLARTNGNRTRAAQALGIAVSTLYEKLKKYQL